jgi:hypothetical protein
MGKIAVPYYSIHFWTRKRKGKNLLNLMCPKLLHACNCSPPVPLTYGESSPLKFQISCPFSIAYIIKNNCLMERFIVGDTM